MDCSRPGYSVREMIQARILEWDAMPSSRVSSQCRDQTHISFNSCITGRVFTVEPWGKPMTNLDSIIKKQRYHFETKVPMVKTMFFFLVVMFRCESWTIKKAEWRRIDAFKLWY